MRRSLFAAILLVLLLATFAWPLQFGRGSVSTFPPETRSPRKHPRIARMEREHLKAMNRERYERIKADSEKLLELATEMHSEMELRDENFLSIKVINNAEEIEKLATSVREKMTEYIGPGPGLQ